MLKYRTAALATAAALCVVGATALAMDQGHTLDVDLPDGSIARIDYRGAVAPHVRIERAVRIMPGMLVDPFEPASFDAFDAIAADMSRQAEAMIRQFDLLQREASVPVDKEPPTVVANWPAGSVRYRYVFTSDGTSGCTRTWQLASQGAHQPPRITAASYGNCARDSASHPDAGTTAAVRQPGSTAPSTTA